MTEIRRVAKTDQTAAALRREFITEMVARYYGRPALEAEVDEELGVRPYDLAVTLLAFDGDEAVGCAGVRERPEYTELKCLYVRPSQRGTGLSSRLVAEAERAAVELGGTKIRLETRGDLIEARRLYARLGYVEIPPYGSDPYTEHSFEKQLSETERMLPQ